MHVATINIPGIISACTRVHFTFIFTIVSQVSWACIFSVGQEARVEVNK